MKQGVKDPKSLVKKVAIVRSARQKDARGAVSYISEDNPNIY